MSDSKEDASKWRMYAYYFGFSSTGNRDVDRILSAVACAGKGYHHTEGWCEPTEPYPHLRGNSYAEMIQNAATDAAAAIEALEAENARLLALLASKDQRVGK
jgi:hypothetical protein